MTGTAALRAPTMHSDASPDEGIGVSVIVPVTERPDSLVELYREYSAPLRELGRRFEFLYAAEPWFRPHTAELTQLAVQGEPIRVLEVGQGVGEAALLRLAASACRAEIVVTLPAYRRVEANALKKLVSGVENGADVVTARRWPRRDSYINRVQGWAFHSLLAGLGRNKLHDVACGVRAFRLEVLKEIPLYGDFFRFLPLLALREGYDVREVDCAQHEADTRSRIYSPGVYLRRLLDILGLFFLARFIEKPLRFFGLIGSLLGIGGGVMLAVLLLQRLGGRGIADRPLLLLGVLLVVLGVQAIALGLVGEIIVHLHAPWSRTYRIARPDAADEGVGRLVGGPLTEDHLDG